MQLKEFYDYKNQLMEDLLTSESIVNLLDDSIPIQEAEKLAYKQVFPCEYVPDTVQEGKTFICFDVDVQESVNKTFLLPTLYIWVFTHRSKLRLPEGGVRTDKLCSEICEAINGSRMYGLGELNLYSVKRFAPMTDYQGKVMAFHAKDFNRQFTPNKPTPTNRKTG
ncbi:MAG: hypothetical protein J6Y20_14500 [Lachnospiraceae bacterium]|nr:hypothetical protein [Lachnospiraceae bacterium]